MKERKGKGESELLIRPSLRPFPPAAAYWTHLNNQQEGRAAAEPPRLEGKRPRPPGAGCVKILFVFVSKQETSANTPAESCEAFRSRRRDLPLESSENCHPTSSGMNRCTPAAHQGAMKEKEGSLPNA